MFGWLRRMMGDPGSGRVVMYERFTDRARKVLQLANQEAQRFNHEFIGTEHILLGLVAEGHGVAANVLKNLDIDLRKIRLEVEKIVQNGPGGEQIVSGRLPHTPRTKRVIEYAIEEARSLGHNYVGTEHLLLGLLREQEAVAAQVLMNLDLKLEDVREEVRNLLGHNLPAPPVAPLPEELRPHVVSIATLPTPPTDEQIRLIEERIDRLNVEKEQFALGGDFERAAKCRDEADALARLVAWYRWDRDQL
jgi:hypothetical protein